jgi:hypothetical protein
VEAPIEYKCHDFAMRNDLCLIHPFIVGYKFLATSAIADEEFSP